MSQITEKKATHTIVSPLLLLKKSFKWILALTNFIWNYSLRLDRNLSKYVDSNIPKTADLLERRKGNQVLTTPNDKISKLERLAILKEQGVLTETEFLQEKQLILKEKD